MRLAELIDGLGLNVRAAGAGDDRSLSLRICDITEDSRTALPGSLFIARPGTRTDGRGFIEAAIRAGAEAVLTDTPPDEPTLAAHPGVAFIVAGDVPRAAALLAERFFGNPTRSLKLMGVTGTNGKTTIAHAVHQLLNASKRRCGLIGTVMIDDGREIAEAVMTTPPACELSGTFAHMLEAGCVAAAMEVSSHSLDQHRTTALDYDVAVFTNLTGDHLDYHGTMERYADAKATLFRLLRDDAVAIVNADDPWHTRMLRECGARVLRCSLDGATGAECTVDAQPPTFDGTRAAFMGPWGRIETTIAMVGRHNLMNCLQAIASAHVMGVPVDALARAASQLAAPPGRLERVTAPGVEHPFAVFVDYAHTDDALANVLRAARPLVSPGGSLRVLFGCGGDRDRTKRPRMARVCCELADHVTVTSDNPRTEQPSAIIDDILRGAPDSARHRLAIDADRRAAIHGAVASCVPGDVLVIAGKGHETYQLLPDGHGGIRRTDFDDRIVAREALAARSPQPA